MLTINLAAIKSNVALLKATAPRSQFMAVVKDNAYGHGLIEVSRAAVEAGADWLGVVHLHEGERLRQAGIDVPILMLGYVSAEEVSRAVDAAVDVPVMSLEHAQELARVVPTTSTLRVHLKVETGLQRFGVRDDELNAVRSLLEHAPFQLVGVYSHLAAVEDALLDFTHAQLERFRLLTADFPPTVVRHIGATAATLLLPEAHLDMVRCGIGIYGLWPSPEAQHQAHAHGISLIPALRWTEPIRAFHTVDINQPVGYGCTWKPDRPSRVALLDVGYADGLPRALSNQGIVTISGQPCPIVGRICSNVTFVDVTGVTTQIGDDVTLLAADESSPASIDQQAERAGTINYDLVIRLPEHLRRRYS